MTIKIEDLRNIGIIAHIDAGKTTLTERMLYYSGQSYKMGDVDKGNTVTDFDSEEQERGITIYGACVSFKWLDKTINLIDTPGHVDFTAEVERALRVLDGAVVVFSARERVQAQSLTVWRQANHYRVPRIVFINKMDREGADFEGTIDEIRTRLDAKPIVLQIPYGSGPSHHPNPFRGVIDLIEMKLLQFSDEDLGKTVTAQDVPAEIRGEAEAWRNQLLEQLVDYSDELAMLLLEEAPVPTNLIRQVLREATLLSQIQPVFCGAAFQRIGVQPVLDGVVHYLPNPLDLPPVEGQPVAQKERKGHKKPKADDEVRLEKRHPDVKEPFAALVFKIVVSKHGDVFLVRVYSGKLSANSRVYNPRIDKKENVSQLWRIFADSRTQIPNVEAGDIIGVIGLKESITGDTLCDPAHPLLLESITFPETVISMAIEPDSSADRKKLADTLEHLKRQDPTFRSNANEETGQTIISGMGELHLEIIKNRLLRDFALNVRVHKPRVSYRETIARAVTVTGECNRQVAGQTLFAAVELKLEPTADATAPVSVENALSDELPDEAAKPVLETLNDLIHGGGMLGFPLMNVKATALNVKFLEDQLDERALRIATNEAFTKALQGGGLVLLEPIMKLEVLVPEEYVGDIMGDLLKRRARVTNTFERGQQRQIEAEVPLAQVFGYSNAMRSLSAGLASCSMQPCSYNAAPPEVLQEFV